MDCASASFYRLRFLPIIHRLVRSDTQQPGLKRTPGLKRAKIPHDGEEGFLANLFRIFVAEIRGELEYEARGDWIVFVE